MGSIKTRLSRLEAQEAGWGYKDTLLLDKALACLTTEDLLLLTEYLRRGDGEYAQPTEAEEAVLLRVSERFEEVKNGDHRQTHR